MATEKLSKSFVNKILKNYANNFWRIFLVFKAFTSKNGFFIFSEIYSSHFEK
jgi:hypothetical protein